MSRALELASRGLFSTPPNPAVGCVLVREGSIVGQGFHERAGEPHAEVFALREAGDAAQGATAYVTLEPCSHHGRTPPCADALVRAGVSRVVCAMLDPNPGVNGRGLERLRAAGIETLAGLLEHEARELNRGFVSRMQRGRPWVTVKMAASADGRTALQNGASQWITSEEARADAQRLRARSSAILTGSGTVLADNPRLTVRDPAFADHPRAPIRVVLDRRLRSQPTAHVFDRAARNLLFTALHSGPTKPWSAANVGVERVPLVGGRLDLHAVLTRLAELECNEVLVEAGATLAGAFVTAGLTDEIVLYLAPTVLGPTAQPVLEIPALPSLAARRNYVWHDVRRTGPDLRLTLRPAVVSSGEG